MRNGTAEYWPKATRERPCPKCGKLNRCTIAPDGKAGHCFRAGETWHAAGINGHANGNGHGTGYVGAAHRKPAAANSTGGKVFATAEQAIAAAGRNIDGGQLANVWTYHAADGAEVMRVARFNLADGSKQFRPVHFDMAGWHIGDPPEPLPLYRLDELPADGTLYACEGEKATDAARSIGLAAFTSAHGSSAAEKTDWTPLASRKVHILIDNDTAGRKYGQHVARILIGLGCRVKVIELPGLPDGGDIVEFIDARDSQDSEAIAAEIVALAEAVAWTEPLRSVSAGALIDENPELYAPIITGIARVCEVGNIVAAPKMNKSWLVLSLLLSFVSRRAWLGVFAMAGGKAWLIDNELHKPTISHRLPAVAAALGILKSEWAEQIDVLSLRGRLIGLEDLEAMILRTAPGTYGLLIFDALYRFFPEGFDENSNANWTALYNRLDRWATHLKCTIVLIHHSSKGVQGGKSVTDTGAGAGAQSRAADFHIVIREHEEADCAVMDGVVRSWPPIGRIGLRWKYPLWGADSSLDVNRLKRDPSRGGRPKKSESAGESSKEPEAPWTPERFAKEFAGETATPREVIEGKAKRAGIAFRTIGTLIAECEHLGMLHLHRKKGSNAKLYATKPAELFDGAQGVSLSHTPPAPPTGRRRKSATR